MSDETKKEGQSENQPKATTENQPTQQASGLGTLPRPKPAIAHGMRKVATRATEALRMQDQQQSTRLTEAQEKASSDKSVLPDSDDTK